MFTFLFRVTNFNTTTKVIVTILISLVIFLVLMEVVFPRVIEYMVPSGANTIG